MRVIGTAGHVDHGKSTLIEALTGIHPDRLKEEQAREMTIDLGFGWLTLPNGEELGIVDVPGHRDFIENMLSGIGGIDAALLVIAADEGIMPQTREHLAILNLLQIPAGLIVLTKTDLAPEPGWLDLIESDIRSVVAGTVLEAAPILRVSARKRSGLEELVAALETVLKDRPARPDLDRPRLPVDRVFTMSGFGTVVTGTLLDGSLAVGDEIEVLPAGSRGRVRGLQTHRKKEDRAVPGSRTAANISGIDLEAVHRADVLARPGQYHPTRRLDARFQALPDLAADLNHGDEVKFFIGASESIGRLRLLGTESLQPGGQGWIQLELRDPVITVRGDRYILRRPSPGVTLGGGIVVDPQPKGRHKRFDAGVLKSLGELAEGSPADVFLQTLAALDAATLGEVITKSRLEAARAGAALETLVQGGQVIQLEAAAAASTDRLMMTLPNWNRVRTRLEGLLDSYHGQFPLRRGIPREELKSKMSLAPRTWNAVLARLLQEGTVLENRGALARPGHRVVLGPAERERASRLTRLIEQNPYSPPGFKDCEDELGEELLNALIDSGELVAVSPEVIFRRQEYDAMLTGLRAIAAARGRFSLAEVRDQFNTSRKYAQALLEHLDSIGMTVREGDYRKFRK